MTERFSSLAKQEGVGEKDPARAPEYGYIYMY